VSSELENVLSQVKQLDHQDQDQLISYLKDRSPQSQQHSDNPWLAIAGDLVDDPFFDEYMAAIEQYRQNLDAERCFEFFDRVQC
jgi:hypothetical protein